METKRRIGIIAAGLAGFADATYLSVKHLYKSDAGCLVTEGCDVVLNSEYAVLLGVPLAYLGMAYYTVVLALVTAEWAHRNAIFNQMLKGVVIAGLGFSAYLLYVQAIVLNAFCSWCLFSAGITVIMAALILTAGKAETDSDRSGGR